MKLKKFMAAGLATVMTVAMATTAFAADVTDAANATGTIEGEGSIEGYVEKEIFCVVLPTVTATPFKIDPQELLKATSSTDKLGADAAASAAAFSSAADGYGEKVMFQKSGATDTWLQKSEDITVVNKSSYDVDVKVTAKVTGNKKDGKYNIALVDKSAADWDATRKDTYMELKLTPTTGTLTGAAVSATTAGDAVVLTDAAEGVTVTQKLTAAPSTLFKITKGASGYTYSIDSTKEATTALNQVAFNLEGTVNKTANWKEFNADADSALKVNLTYEVKKYIAPPTVTVGTDGKITVKGLVDGKAFVGMDVSNGEATVPNCHTDGANLSFDASKYDAAKATGEFTAELKDAYMAWAKGKTLTVTVRLSDGTKVTGTANIPA